MSEPVVDHIIAVHDPSRPVERAVGSVLDQTEEAVRVSVVCHNTPRNDIAARLGRFARDDRLRLLDCRDELRSPAGPFNVGLAAATAHFTSIMGSDDALAPGAMDSWLALQRATGADVVVPRLAHAGGAIIPTPPARPFRRTRLDGVQDRLAYRSAPLGLVSRSRFGQLRFIPGLATGEDIDYSLRLWFSDARIAFDRSGPAYLVHDDAPGRVTRTARPVADELAFLDRLAGSDAIGTLDLRERRSVVVKIVRVNLFSAVLNRPDSAQWVTAERVALAAGLAKCLAIAPGSLELLSRADRRLIDLIADPGTPAADLLEAAHRRRVFLRPAALLPRNPAHALARDAPLRFAGASALVRLGL